MNITLQLQRLDDLIVKHTQPPVTAILRNQLHPLLDQIEAYVEAAQAKAHAFDEQTRKIAETNEDHARRIAQLTQEHEKQITDLFLFEEHKRHRNENGVGQGTDPFTSSAE